MRYVFGECTLDTQRYELHRAGRICPLRRKAFQVLAYLLAHADRVVSKQELCEQVWPEQFISDAALESALKAIRRALGDNRRDQRLLQTVYGQGYRFVAAVTTGDPALPDRATPLAAPRAPMPRPGLSLQGPQRCVPTVVGREAELAQLARWFERAQDGERHLVFVTGEPGIGKTTLVDAFLGRLADAAHVWIGRGQCVEEFGAGEAYRPVLEALGRLGRGPGGQALVALLAQQAPTWLVQMPGLVGAADLEALTRRLAGATRERMLRELAEALERLTAQQPLVLVLEDLHWSDPSTLDLLAVLARHREPARLLLIGTYRPYEVPRRAHPLAAVMQELQLHGCGVEVPVTLLSEDAIAAYLGARFPGLPCVDRLARLVHRHTEGQPLFMVTLVDAWLTQGVLTEQDGAWALPAGVEALHDRVPDSVRQMIDGQLDRLSPEEQRVLEAGSVAGVAFSAAAVAAGLGQAVAQVDDACAALARRGQWLQAVGDQRWPDGTVAGGYRFVHALYHHVLYHRVSAARRVQLHQCIGVREERGYGAEAEARAAELAVHFARGRDVPRAVQYLRQAGENALQRYSYQEAITHFSQGLTLLATLPATPARAQQELALQLALGPALMTSKGPVPAVEQAYARARALCQQVGETPQLFAALQGLAWFYEGQGVLHTARELEEQLVRQAQRLAAPTPRLEAHAALGTTLFFLGDYATAAAHLAQGIALADPAEQRALALRSVGLVAPGVRCLALAAHTRWCLGYPAQAVRWGQEALALAQEVAHPQSLAFAYNWAAFLSYRRREAPVVQQHCSLWQGIYEFLQGFLKRQHTCRNDRYIIHPRIQKCFWWFCESVRVLVLLSHAKLVCSMIFLAFCFPKCT
jgi:DNA-binding winged helix-turn-helix (wHTH) protein/tetratricopeptide (TPR) repeat protein